MSSNTIKIITTEDVITINQAICKRDNHKHICMDQKKVESALSTAFYPGLYPFVHGEIASVGGALCFYLIKSHAFFDGNKRTAAISAATFMSLNDYELIYQYNQEFNHFADIIEKCADNKIAKEELMSWFENHNQAIKHS